MSFCDRQEPVKFVCFWAGGLAISLSSPFLQPLPALAQLIPDNSLGTESSVVNLDRLVDGLPADLIEGGAARGGNLFHSFQEFNVATGQSVYFANPIDIENILTRVTGGNLSNIDGLLGVAGAANLFLLNPNGVIFGPNARLDINGSFLTSTGSSFTFADGSEFSATPTGEELLSVSVPLGVQFNNPQGDITSAGTLSTGQDLTLLGNTVNLAGQVSAGHDLTLRAADTVQIRDGAAQPFVAAARNDLLVQGNQAVDIFALNHADSGLQAGGDLTLRSPTPVIGDARYQSGGNFRIEQLDESLGTLISPNDPVIRAAGDVAFDSYEGASLHILAGGSVTVPGAIEITGADPANGLVETVTLSDGSTVDINGQATPTLDIRAGTLAVNPTGAVGDTAGFVPEVPETMAGAISADITIGSIRNEGGTVFLTNQYQPNLALVGGDIQVGAIATSAVGKADATTSPLTQLQVQGGGVVIDSRQGIQTGNVDTFADAYVNGSGVNEIGDTNVQATGGAIRFNAQDAITTENLNSSVFADATLNVNANQLMDADGNLSVIGGTVGNVTVSGTGGEIVLSSNGPIATGNLASWVDMTVFANASATDFTVVGELLDSGMAVDEAAAAAAAATGGTIGNVAVTSTGGAIALKSDAAITTGNVDSSSWAIAEVIAAADASAGALASTEADALAVARGGDIGEVSLTSFGGGITLDSAAAILTGNLDSWARGEVFTKTEANAAASALAGAFVDTDFVLGETMTTDATAIGGTIGETLVAVTGGAIALKSDAAITTGRVDSSAEGNVEASAEARDGGPDVRMFPGVFAEALATGGVIGDVTMASAGGAIALESDGSITTGDLNASADVLMKALASASFSITDAVTVAVVEARGGEIGDSTVTSKGGTINLDSLALIRTDELDSSASVGATASTRADVNIFASTFDVSAKVNAIGGTIGDVIATSTGAAIALDSPASIHIGNLNSSGSASTSVSANAAGAAFVDARAFVDVKGGAVGNAIVTSTGGEIALEGNDLTTGDMNSSVEAKAEATAFAAMVSNAERTTVNVNGGTIGDVTVTSTSGAITLRSEDAIMTGTLNSSADVEVDAAATEPLETFGGPFVRATTIGNVTVTSSGGAITLESQDAITTGTLDSSAVGTVVAAADVYQLPTSFAPSRTIGDLTVTSTGGAINLGSPAAIKTGHVNSLAKASAYGFALASVPAFATGEVTGGTIGSIAVTSTAGVIELDTLETIMTGELKASATANAGADVGADVGASAGGSIDDVNLTSNGGAVTLNGSNAITIGNLSSSANANADAIADRGDITIGNQRARAAGGTVNLTSHSGEVDLNAGGSIRSNVLNGDGDGGDIRIEGTSLQLANNVLTTTVAGEGEAGDITIVVPGNTVISGSRLLTGRESGADGIGSAGAIAITTGSLQLSDFSFLNTATLGTGDAGDVTLTTTQGDIFLTDSSIFSLTALTGNAGEISLQSAGVLRLVGNSVISTTVALGAEGTGGDIRITAPGGVFLDGRGASTVPVDGATALGSSSLEESEPNDFWRINPDPDNFVFFPFFQDPGTGALVFDLSNSQAIGAAFGIADSNNPNFNVPFSTETPYVAILGKGGGSNILNSSDTYSFEVNAVGTQVTFDIDAVETADPSRTLDLILRLYDDQGNELAFNNNAPTTLGAAGSDSPNDPYFTYIFNEPGTYLIRVLQTGSLVGTDTRLASLLEPSEFGIRDGSYTLNVSRTDDFLVNSGITTQTRSSGPSGNITINAPIIDIQNGSQISAATLRDGQAGDITLQPLGDGQSLTINIVGEGSQISSSTLNTGAGGNVTLSTREIRFNDGGQIAASTSGSGPGGSINVIGNSPLTLRGDGRLTVAALGANSGRAGNLNVQASELLRLRDGVELSATSGSAQGGGNINIAVEGGSLVMRGGSFINATSTNPSAGDGGNITIRLSDGFLIAAPGQNNDIIANAVGGNGGNINISALRLFGFSLQDEPNVSLLRGNNTNDISASSQVGLPGAIALDTLALDPSQGLVELPLNLEDRANQVTPSCGLGNPDDGSEFVVTGRGGLPPSPNDPLAADGVSVPWVMDEGDTSTVAVTPPAPTTTPLLVEADGVAIDAEGNAYFVAQGSTAAAVSQPSASVCRAVSTTR